jgi:hypothetical protein
MRFLTPAVVFLSLAPSAFCWGDVGHRTVAYIAEKCLTEQNSKIVDGILRSSSSFDISDAATWADQIKRGPHAREYTKMWHYIGE